MVYHRVNCHMSAFWVNEITHTVGPVGFTETFSKKLEDPTISGWWFGPFFIFPYIGNFIIPTDFHSYFSEGWLNHQPDHQYITIPILTIYILTIILPSKYTHHYITIYIHQPDIQPTHHYITIYIHQPDIQPAFFSGIQFINSSPAVPGGASVSFGPWWSRCSTFVAAWELGRLDSNCALGVVQVLRGYQ